MSFKSFIIYLEEVYIKNSQQKLSTPNASLITIITRARRLKFFLNVFATIEISLSVLKSDI